MTTKTVARDVMATRVVTISPDATIEAAGRILIEAGVSGAPVVERDGRLVGVISEYQLLELVYNTELRSQVVGDFMTRDVFAVAENDPLESVATLFIVHRIRRVPVLAQSRVVGIITRRDLLKKLIQGEFRAMSSAGTH